MQPKNSPPRKLMEEAKGAEVEVEMDLMEKLGPVMEGMSPAERKALEASSLSLASKIVGEAIARGQAMQAFAVALTAMNAFRESKGENPIDPESTNPMMLASMLEELARDEDFMEFIAGEVELEEEDTQELIMRGEGLPLEDEDEDEMGESTNAKRIMNRRNTLMGAI